MGVIRPPWISKKWFNQCTFNYCDHFGNKELLATVCKICKEEIERIEEYKKEGKDPYSWENVFKEVANDLAQSMSLLYKDAKQMGIDLDNLPDEEFPEPPPADSYPIYQLVKKYGDKIEKAMRNLESVPIYTDIELVEKVIDVLSHSHHYIIAKIGRALSGRWRWKNDSVLDDLHDDKTAAFFAYVAVERNARALLTLAKHKPLYDLREEHLKLASLSLDLCTSIKQEFFPKDELFFEEFGVEDIESSTKPHLIH